MDVATTLSEFRAERAQLEEPVGLVPTMGYLHEGHLSLARLARSSCVSVVASIFVNPTQFAASEDLASYPRDLDRDLELLDKEGVDLVLAPSSNDEFYPTGYDTWVDVAGITQRLEGASRPTHFRGVATIVAKLFNIVRPQRAFFGQKDAQQVIVIHRLIRDLNFDVKLILGSTIREPDGLAMSSRNAYLSKEERPAATVLHRCLELVESLYVDGERSAENLRHAMIEVLQAEPLAQPDYLSIADTDTLEELEGIDGKALVSLAVRIGSTRLIDNTVLPPGQSLF
ncbi:pantoate--beta-alanine ligase [Candidatus Bipolaricaulota bacterium]|nr:pantoate--beta-alanine ligase [Candidatus Bipolaricaulota bacterium]